MLNSDISQALNMGTIDLEENEYFRLSKYIMDHFGIKLPPSKKTLLQCRLQKRLKHLKHKDFKQYVDYVFSSKGQQEEVSHMIDAVCTNKTDFFREPVHFDYLMNGGLQDYLERSGKRRLTIWSAGCSSGEEPYTLAMVLKEISRENKMLDFSILATDISETILENAIRGIYSEEKVCPVPEDYKIKYMLKGKNEYANMVRMSAEIRSKIEFRKFNLLATDFRLLGKFDIIFCRNVLIYFDREVQFRILRQMSSMLNQSGLLFLGHSESITGYALPLKHIKPTIFRKIN